MLSVCIPVFNDAKNLDNLLESIHDSDLLLHNYEILVSDGNSIDLIDNVMLPQNYYLTNYPNPFNSMTNISFQISESENVNISIYNMNGQLIETIVNEEMNPGSYSVSWNAKNVSSDLYFYKLTTGNKTGTNKMILIK